MNAPGPPTRPGASPILNPLHPVPGRSARQVSTSRLPMKAPPRDDRHQRHHGRRRRPAQAARDILPLTKITSRLRLPPLHPAHVQASGPTTIQLPMAPAHPRLFWWWMSSTSFGAPGPPICLSDPPPCVIASTAPLLGVRRHLRHPRCPNPARRWLHYAGQIFSSSSRRRALDRGGALTPRVLSAHTAYGIGPAAACSPSLPRRRGHPAARINQPTPPTRRPNLAQAASSGWPDTRCHGPAVNVHAERLAPGTGQSSAPSPPSNNLGRQAAGTAPSKTLPSASPASWACVI